MKPKFLLILSVAVIGFSASGFVWKKSLVPKQGPVKTLEEMAALLPDIIKRNDSNAYFKLFVNEQEFSVLLNNSSLTIEKKNSILITRKGEPIKEKTYETFRKIQQELKGLFIDWGTLSIELKKISVEKKDNIELGRLRVEFKCNQKTFFITTRELVKTPTGWKLTHNIDFENRGNEEENARIMAIRDSTIADSVMRADIAIFIADSLAVDSVRRADEAMMMRAQLIADSTRMADSLQKAGKMKQEQKKRKGK